MNGNSPRYGFFFIRIDVIDKTRKEVVWQLKAERKFNGSIFCSVMTMSNIQLPLSKVTSSALTNIEAHVLMEMQNLDRRPKQGALHAGVLANTAIK